MKSIAYLTGRTGTVAPYLAATFHQHGYEVVGNHLRIEKEEDIPRSIEDVRFYNPSVIIHLAMGPIVWAKALATWAREHNKTLVYVSTASVYDDQGNGPYTIDSPVHAIQGYGLYKFQSEQAVKEANPHAYLVRIGWQIDPQGSPTSNNMFRFFADQLRSLGKIAVSDQFFPSASFLPDTTLAIVEMIQSHPPGLYFVNGNHHHSLYAIAQRINQRFDCGWVIEKDDSFKRNDILMDERLPVPFL